MTLYRWSILYVWLLFEKYRPLLQKPGNKNRPFHLPSYLLSKGQFAGQFYLFHPIKPGTWLLLFEEYQQSFLKRSSLFVVVLYQHQAERLSLIHISEPTRRTPISY